MAWVLCHIGQFLLACSDILLHTLPLLSLLTKNVSDLNFSSKLNAQLASILAASKNPDVAEICLEMLHYQAENGKW
jgi:hypothetical protein